MCARRPRSRSLTPGFRLAVIVIFCTVTSATYWKNGRAYSGFLAYCVAILGSILVNTLPSENRVGLLFSYWIASKSKPRVPRLLPEFSARAMLMICDDVQSPRSRPSSSCSPGSGPRPQATQSVSVCSPSSLAGPF